MTLGKNLFVAVLYDCILFEFAATVSKDTTYKLPLQTLADSFGHVLRTIKADQYIHRFHTRLEDVKLVIEPLSLSLSALQEYIDSLDDGCFELFPCVVNPVQSNGLIRSPNDLDQLMMNLNLRSTHLSVPGLTHCEKHCFLWEYGQNVPVSYHDDIAVLIQSLRDSLWMSKGSGGESCLCKNGMLGVRKFSR
ncbi:hypothetical protein BGZ65_002926, partial [Modicella reniformis]